ncbi:hypothetical protein GCM10009608_51410 [Pseudonocardia alaniniphila]
MPLRFDDQCRHVHGLNGSGAARPHHEDGLLAWQGRRGGLIEDDSRAGLVRSAGEHVLPRLPDQRGDRDRTQPMREAVQVDQQQRETRRHRRARRGDADVRNEVGFDAAQQ